LAKKEDRRVLRTRQQLRAALLLLIQERGFETLSVQDIIDRANVGRATFYSHFDSKEDLLVSGFDELRAALKVRQREARLREKSSDERLLAFSEEIFAHVMEYREIFRAMAGKRSGAVVQSLILKLMTDLVRDDVKALAPAGANSVRMEALVQFISGGLFGMLMWGLGGKIEMSVEEMNAAFRRLAIPAVKAAAA
jgi:AcrR family transcriptional regulator